MLEIRFYSVCIGLSVDEVGISCAWVCELVLFGFLVFRHWFAMCLSCWQIKHVCFCSGEYSLCVVFNCNCRGVRDAFGVFWVYVYFSSKMWDNLICGTSLDR